MPQCLVRSRDSMRPSADHMTELERTEKEVTKFQRRKSQWNVVQPQIKKAAKKSRHASHCMSEPWPPLRICPSEAWMPL